MDEKKKDGGTRVKFTLKMWGVVLNNGKEIQELSICWCVSTTPAAVSDISSRWVSDEKFLHKQITDLISAREACLEIEPAGP